jgi:pilus assembly protein Flp/PilA
MIKPMVGFDMRSFLLHFLKNSAGATAIEYGLIAGALAIVVLTAMNAITPGVLAKFNAVAASFP